MEGKTTIQLPLDLTNQVALKRFLLELINYVDMATGLKGNAKVSTEPWVINNLAGYTTNVALNTTLEAYGTKDYITSQLLPYATDSDINNALLPYATQSYVISALVGYATESYVTSALVGYATESWVSTNYTYNPEQTTEALLSQTISTTYVQSEVQAISTKVDNILGKLALANIIA